jgi:hypothetical protein
MATSPNFNWAEPDNTDLVRNGALAIRTAVDAIDTSMADLLGGTTGQVLSKTSNTSMDFTWTTPSTAAGYADNAVLNSAFQIWQRGTSISYSNNQLYNADRWLGQLPGTGTISRQVTGDTTNLPNIQYCARVQRTSGQTTTTGHFLYQNFESINSIPYAGKQVTYSFYARKGADYSAASSALVANLYSGTGTDQNVLATYTGFATVATTTATLTTTWQRFSVTGTVASTATELALGFTFTPTGTAGANDYFEVTGVMLETAATATAFHTNQPTLATELTACQRYYFRSTAAGANTNFGVGMNQSASAANFYIKLATTMRTNPTAVEFSTLQVSDFAVYGTDITTLSVVSGASGLDSLNVVAGGASGLTSAAPSFLRGKTAGTSYIAFSAEL